MFETDGKRKVWVGERVLRSLKGAKDGWGMTPEQLAKLLDVPKPEVEASCGHLALEGEVEWKGGRWGIRA